LTVECAQRAMFPLSDSVTQARRTRTADHQSVNSRRRAVDSLPSRGETIESQAARCSNCAEQSALWTRQVEKRRRLSTRQAVGYNRNAERAIHKAERLRWIRRTLWWRPPR